jgi:hypothetical protein
MPKSLEASPVRVNQCTSERRKIETIFIQWESSRLQASTIRFKNPFTSFRFNPSTVLQTDGSLASLFYLPDEVCTPPAHLYDIVPYSFQ